MRETERDREREEGRLVGCLTAQQHTSVSQGRICSDIITCCHTEKEVADQTFHFTQSQYTDTGPTSSSTDPIMPGTWQSSHWSANFQVTGMTRPWKKSWRKRDSIPGSSTLKAHTLTTRPTRQLGRRSKKGREVGRDREREEGREGGREGDRDNEEGKETERGRLD